MLEVREIEIRLRVIAHPDDIIDTEEMGRIVGEALNSGLARPGDSFDVRTVEVDGEEAWANDSPWER